MVKLIKNPLKILSEGVVKMVDIYDAVMLSLR